jgi:hypothetical protein
MREIFARRDLRNHEKNRPHKSRLLVEKPTRAHIGSAACLHEFSNALRGVRSRSSMRVMRTIAPDLREGAT